MSFRAYYELNCDGVKCSNAYSAPIATLHYATAMEAAAVGEGWEAFSGTAVGSRRRHLCPDCATKHKIKEEKA